MSSYWGIAINRVSLWRKLVGECNFESAVLCQAIGCRVLRSYNLQGFALFQTIGELHFVRYCLAPGYWASALSCIKLLRNYHCRILPCVKILRTSNL